MNAVLLVAPDFLLMAQVWRVFTWPLADTVSFWSVLNLVFLWLFGRDLEAGIGRSRMAWLFVGIWLSITVSTSVVGTLLPGVGAAGAVPVRDGQPARDGGAVRLSVPGRAL